VNLGWPPSKYESLPYRERLLVVEFALKAMKTQKEEMDRAKKTPRR
jgi:hypothetical protein